MAAIINSIGISLDTGIIKPPVRYKSLVSSVGLKLDNGVLIPKNSFVSKVMSVGIKLDKAEDSVLFYQVF